jgi:CO dehydrogenase/acetyl-CoA synthase beta subunit
MSAFDRYIEDVIGFSESLRKRGGPVKEFDCRGTPQRLQEDLPIAVGPGANPGIILRSDTFLELGNPTAGSCSHLLWTEKPTLIRDGRVTLCGPDIAESAGASLPFGQVLMLAGESLGPPDHERLLQAPIVGDQIEGYMVRSAAENIWSRVSRSVATRGFDFEMLGRSLLSLVKSSAEGVSAMEILFVTTAKEDVKELAGIASSAKTVGSEILKETWRARGFEVDCDYDCSSCHDKPVCDDVRDVLVDLKKKKASQKKAARAATERES